MTNTTDRVSQLSPEEKRALLAKLLQQKTSKAKVFPLSFTQQRLWFLDQLTPNTPTYNMPAVIELGGVLNVDALQQSLNTIVRRHEVLRTCFPAVDGQPTQQIIPPAPVPVPFLDLRSLPVLKRETHARSLVQEETQKPFDLARGPVLRAQLLQLDDTRHVLTLTIHHIVFDNWSMGVFIQEFATLYTMFSKQGADVAPLPELPLQYADVAVWQREQLQGAALDAQLDYWKKHLDQAPTVLELPTDRPRPAIQTFRGANHTLRIPPPLTAAIKQVSRQAGVTLFMTLLAAFKVLLARYTNQRNIVVGSPVTGRSRTELEGLIGLFFNTLVLHTDLSGDLTFQELVQRVRDVCLGAYAHQELPFEKLVEELRLERDLSHTLLFQVLFDFHSASSASTKTIDLPGLAVRWWESPVETAKFDLSLTITDAEHELTGAIEYNTDLFDATTIARMAEHYLTLLSGIVAQPAARLADLPLLTTAEREELIVQRNATAASFPDDCYHQLFEQQVARTPDACAVVFGEQRLTYAELDARANQLAHHLRTLGIRPGDGVGIYIHRSIEMLVGLLGIFKAGAAFVPLDPAFPVERLRYILADAAAPVVLTQAELCHQLPTYSGQVICLDTDWAVISTAPTTRPEVAVTADYLAYLIYTSGSTGRPKGVLIPHRGLVNYLLWCCDAYTAAAGRGAPVHASIAADAIFPSLFAPLLVGTTVFLLPITDPLPALSHDLQTNGQYSLVKITPSQLEVLQHHLSTTTTGLTSTDATDWIHTLVVGAEEVRGEVLAFWRQAAPAMTILNEYGPTETVVGCSIYAVPPKQVKPGTVPIGLPIANLTFYVLDRHLQPVPIGVPGELFIGGVGVAWGYHQRPDLTAEKFIPDPFGGQAGGRLYRTGDLVRAIADFAGNIEFLGRIDDQVKIRGYRVEPGEVAEVLQQHEAIRESVVLARQEPGSTERRLIAYVVPHTMPAPDTEELRSFLRAHLPEYMVPSTFVVLEALPLAPHGKLDRQALPLPSREHTEAAAVIAPRNHWEHQLATVWKDVLGVTEIGVTDNFFELGGHSLSAIRLIARIQQQFQRELPLSTLFQAPTIEQFAAILQQTEAALWSPLVAIQPMGDKRPFFCIHASGGTVLSYHHLAHHLGSDRPFYGLQAPPLHEVGSSEVRIEQMAAQYITAIREVQAHGPYLLGGWSFGGLVAFEMAQQLQRQGEEVGLLALLDTRTPGTFGSGEDLSDGLVLAAIAQEHALEAGKELILSIDDLQQMEPDDQLEYILGEIKRVNLDFGVDLAWIRQFVKGLRAREQAVHRYRPQPYPGRITLFRAAEEDAEIAKIAKIMQRDSSDPTYGWSTVGLEPVERYIIPGYHNMMVFEPNVRVVAAHLKTCLDRVDAAQ